MDREVSIVLSGERADYRKVAQKWYGLTNEQMIGMDVHHNPARHEGGRDIPEHLYVYHNTLHSSVHEDEFVLWSRVGSQAAHKEKDDQGRSKTAVRASEILHEEKDEQGRSLHAIKCFEGVNERLHEEKDNQNRSKHAVKMNERAHAEKDENGESLKGKRDGQRINAQKWEDPDHPELGIHNPGNLVKVQRARGYPHGPENRRKVY
jgi:hypothetical protein